MVRTEIKMESTNKTDSEFIALDLQAKRADDGSMRHNK
jgi:hypothetical protein